MATRIRTLNFLPDIFKTDTNSQFLSATLDQIVQQPDIAKSEGYIGSKFGNGVDASEKYVVEPTKTRQDYQLTPGVIFTKKDSSVAEDFITYPEVIDSIKLNGGITDNHNRLWSNQFYSWDSMIDFDKLINYNQYYWLPDGPTAVAIESLSVTKISDITGKNSYTSENGVEFTNGLKVIFYNADPVSYNNKEYYVEGVGSGIKLVPVSELVAPEIFTISEYLPWSSIPWDIGKWDIRFYVPKYQDYILISRESEDRNAWSRSNRWFHEDVIRSTGKYNKDPDYANNLLTTVNRAKRPIVEFYPDLRLFNSGIRGKAPVDFIDFRTTDAFSDVAGQFKWYPDTETFCDYSSTTVIDQTNLPPTQCTITLDNSAVVGKQFYVNQFIVDVNKDPITNNPLPSVLPLGAQITDIVVGATQTVLSVKWSSSTIISTPVAGSCIFGIDDVTGEYYLFDGARVIFAADSNPNVRNKIYNARFSTPVSGSGLVITLTVADDGDIEEYDQTVVTRGYNYKSYSFWYDSDKWVNAQRKFKLNQNPFFDIFDSNGISFGDTSIYQNSSFKGCTIFQYGVGSGTSDVILGFPLRYDGISTLGDISFDVPINTDTFDYTINNDYYTKNIRDGFIHQHTGRYDYTRRIGWETAVEESVQPQIFNFDYIAESKLSTVTCDISANPRSDSMWPTVQLYFNNVRQDPSTYSYTTTDKTTVIEFVPPLENTPIQVSIISNQVSNIGYYDIPINLNNNPFNELMSTVSTGDIRSHYQSIFYNAPGLTGSYLGNNNYRDAGSNGTLIKYGNRIIQNSSSFVLPASLLRDSKYNLYNSIQYNSQSYINFKNLLVGTVNSSAYNRGYTPAYMLDDALDQIAASKSDSSPFFWSDMLPSKSPYHQASYTFANSLSTSIFPLSRIYDFTTSNYYGVLVYLTRTVNNITREIQLTNRIDYIISDTSPSVTVTKDLIAGDVITVREYNQTYGSYVPNTPTKIGLYPAFKPGIVLDDAYSVPTYFIRGHDGSYTKLYGELDVNGDLIDFRDQVLLEFETRIYNNLKLSGELPIDLYTIEPGFWRNNEYSYNEFIEMYSTGFLNWIGQNRIEYFRQLYNPGNEFTYNYRLSSNKVDNEPLDIGFWRGVYLNWYDTTRPDIAPWEMLHYVEKPDWWDNYYGQAPYTSDNTLLWDDLSRGYDYNNGNPRIIKTAIRPDLLKVIPVDSNGKLLSPFDSIVGNYINKNLRKDWAIGDIAPAEFSYRRSSTWPFDLMRLIALQKPAKFYNLGVDVDNYKYSSEFNQYLVNGRSHLNIRDIQIYGNGISKASYLNWIVDYQKQYGIDATPELESFFNNLDVRLVYRMAGYSDKKLLKYYLEKSAPNVRSSSLLIPDESFRILLHNNQPFDRIVYSAVIIQQTSTGFKIYGNSQEKAYFKTLAPNINGNYATVNVENLSVNIANDYTNRVLMVPYSTEFTTVNEVSQFLASYGKYLENQGVQFNNIEDGLEVNWQQMVAEFLYWSQGGWEVGSIVTINPAATEFTINKDSYIVQPLTLQQQNFILNQDLYPISNNNLAVYRNGVEFNVKTLNQGDTIAYGQFNINNFEHGIVFDNYTLFNDEVYRLVTGLRQYRILARGSKTASWNGTVDAAGFIINQDNIKEWTENTKYTAGMIVTYKNKFWIATKLMQPSLTFDESVWKITDYDEIQKGLLPNSSTNSYESNLYYDLNTPNLERDADLLAFSLIGFRPRDYMASADLSDITQVNVYRNFIEQKGTPLMASLFKGAQLQQGGIDYNIYEIWQIKAGEFGGVLNHNFIEVILNEKYLTGNPAILALKDGMHVDGAQQCTQLYELYNYGRKIEGINILPVLKNPYNKLFNDAGYVNFDDVKTYSYYYFGLPTATYPLSNIYMRDFIWIADFLGKWQILSPISVGTMDGTTCNGGIVVSSIVNNLDGTATVIFNGPHGLEKTNPFAIINFSDAVNGYYVVNDVVDQYSVLVTLTSNTFNNVLTGNGIAMKFVSHNVEKPADILSLPLLDREFTANKAWVDTGIGGGWTVYEKTINYQYATALENNDTKTYGSSVAANKEFGIIIGDLETGNLKRYIYNKYNPLDGGYTQLLEDFTAGEISNIVRITSNLTSFTVETINNSSSWVPGTMITITGASPSKYNGTWEIISGTANSFTVNSDINPGASLLNTGVVKSNTLTGPGLGYNLVVKGTTLIATQPGFSIFVYELIQNGGLGKIQFVQRIDNPGNSLSWASSVDLSGDRRWLFVSDLMSQNGNTYNIVSITSTPTSFTVTTPNNPKSWVPGSVVTISGVTPIQYNGRWTIVSGDNTQFTVNTTINAGTPTVLGTVQEPIEEVTVYTGGSTFTGIIYGNILQVTDIDRGRVDMGQTLSGLNLLPGTKIIGDTAGNSYNITSINSTATTFTVNTSNNPTVWQPGTTVNIFNAIPASYNGTWTIASGTATSFTVNSNINPGLSISNVGVVQETLNYTITNITPDTNVIGANISKFTVDAITPGQWIPGMEVVITGAIPTIYNGTWTISSGSSTQFTIELTTPVNNPAPITSFGTLQALGNGGLGFYTVYPAQSGWGLMTGTGLFETSTRLPVDQFSNPPSLGDRFGTSISTNYDGSIVAIGAPKKDNTTVSPTMSDWGYTYVFQRLSQNFEYDGVSAPDFKLIWNPATDEDVVVMLNGRTLSNTDFNVNLIIGATWVRLLVPVTYGDIINVSGKDFKPMQMITTESDPRIGVQFGRCVAMNNVGTELLVGAPFELDSDNREGAAYRYTLSGSRFGKLVGTKPCNVPPNTIILINGYVVYIDGNASDVAAQINAFATTALNNLNITNIKASADTVNNLLTIELVNPLLGPVNNKLVITTLDDIVFDQLGITPYTKTQVIRNPHVNESAQFGTTIKFNEVNSVVISAPYDNRYANTTFDFTDDFNQDNDTIFDNNTTQFVDVFKKFGSVYMFDYLGHYDESLDNLGMYVYAQNASDITRSDSVYYKQNYGWDTNAWSSNVWDLMLGPYGQPLDNQSCIGFYDNNLVLGQFRLNYQSKRVVIYRNNKLVPDWHVLRTSSPVVDITKVNDIQLYSRETNTTLDNLDYIDPLQGKLLGAVMENLDFITDIDPANYNSSETDDQGQLVWGSNQVGKLWFNTLNVRFVNYHQEDVNYSGKYWGTVFPGSDVAVYTWIKSDVEPQLYNGPGTPYDINLYAIELLPSATGALVPTYYYWVRNVDVVSSQIGKTLSDSVLQTYIADPQSSGISYFSPIRPNVYGLYNSNSNINDEDTILHVGYGTGKSDDEQHIQVDHIREDYKDDFLSGLPANVNLDTELRYRKFLDSFCGVDERGSAVPDPYLPLKKRSGVDFRPRQSFFYNRHLALKNYLQYVNNVLIQYPIIESKEPSLLFEIGLNYDTTKFWEYVNWWKDGYNDSVKASIQVQSYYQLSTLSVMSGIVVKVLQNGIGRAEWYIYTDTGVWERIGLERGTIQFKDILWDYTGNYGWDGPAWDMKLWDEFPSVETRNILRAINEQLFIEELLIYRNKGLMLMFKYIESESIESQNYLTWLNKTSFIDVEHTVSDLKPTPLYRGDSQDFLRGYIYEIKPYHVVIKEFLLKYKAFDQVNLMVTDFDLPAQYNTDFEEFISPQLVYGDQVYPNKEYPLDDPIWRDPEYINWYRNYGLKFGTIPDYQIARLGQELPINSTTIHANSISSFPINSVVKIQSYIALAWDMKPWDTVLWDELTIEQFIEYIDYTSLSRRYGTLNSVERGFNDTTAQMWEYDTPMYVDLPPVTLLEGGRNYTFTPKVRAVIDTTRYPAPREEAQFEAVMVDTSTDGKYVYKVNMINPGSGYVVTPKIEIDPAFTFYFQSSDVSDKIAATMPNTIVITNANLRTGDRVNYTVGVNTTPISGIDQEIAYYVRVLKTAPFTIALYRTLEDCYLDTHRVELFNVGSGTQHIINYGAIGVPMMTQQPVRGIKSIHAYDRTSYYAAQEWEPNKFYGREYPFRGAKTIRPVLQITDVSDPVIINSSQIEYGKRYTIRDFGGDNIVADINGTTMTVISSEYNRLQVGQEIYGNGVLPGTVITALGTGTGGVGTYTISPTQIVITTDMVSTNTSDQNNWNDIAGTTGIIYRNAYTFVAVKNGYTFNNTQVEAHVAAKLTINYSWNGGLLDPAHTDGVRFNFINSKGKLQEVHLKPIPDVAPFTNNRVEVYTDALFENPVLPGQFISPSSPEFHEYTMFNVGPTTTQISGYIIGDKIVASIDGDTMTVTSSTYNSIEIGQELYGNGILPGTIISGFVSGTGGVGTYTVSPIQTVNSTSITTSGHNLVVNGTTGVLSPGQVLSGNGVHPNTTILGTGNPYPGILPSPNIPPAFTAAFGNGSGSIGVYRVSTQQYVQETGVSQNITVVNNIIKVNSTVGLNVGDPISFDAINIDDLTTFETYYIASINRFTNEIVLKGDVHHFTQNGSGRLVSGGGYLFPSLPIVYGADRVIYRNKVYKCVASANYDSTFVPNNWKPVPHTMNALDRIMCYYQPTVNMPGKDLTQLLEGIRYPNGTYRSNKFDTTYLLNTIIQDPTFGVSPVTDTILGSAFPDGYGPEELVAGLISDAVSIITTSKDSTGAVVGEFRISLDPVGYQNVWRHDLTPPIVAQYFETIDPNTDELIVDDINQFLNPRPISGTAVGGKFMITNLHVNEIVKIDLPPGFSWQTISNYTIEITGTGIFTGTIYFGNELYVQSQYIGTDYVTSEIIGFTDIDIARNALKGLRRGLRNTTTNSFLPVGTKLQPMIDNPVTITPPIKPYRGTTSLQQSLVDTWWYGNFVELTADANIGDTVIFVNDTSNISVGDVITSSSLLGGIDNAITNVPPTTVIAVGLNQITLSAPLIGAIPINYGVQLNIDTDMYSLTNPNLAMNELR